MPPGEIASERFLSLLTTRRGEQMTMPDNRRAGAAVASHRGLIREATEVWNPIGATADRVPYWSPPN